MVKPTQPQRVASAPTWSTVRHGSLTRNQRTVVKHLHYKDEHNLSANRLHATMRSLILRGLVDPETRKLTPAGVELARNLRK